MAKVSRNPGLVGQAVQITSAEFVEPLQLQDLSAMGLPAHKTSAALQWVSESTTFLFCFPDMERMA